MPTGYFNNKKITKVYIGSNVVYRDAPIIIEPIMTLQAVHIDAAKSKNILMYLNDVTAKVGDVVYTNDVLRVKATGTTFKRAPSYYQSNPPISSQTNFENRISASEYSTSFPYGYDTDGVRAAWSASVGFNFPLN